MIILYVEFYAVIGFYMRFEDDSVESAKIVKQWNVKIISVSIFYFILRCLIIIIVIIILIGKKVNILN